MKKERNDRVISIDVLRGLALMGILFVNLPMMESAIDTIAQTKFEVGLRFVYDLLIQTKFYTIFSFLFGVSAYYFMRSQERKGLAFKQLFVKRVIGVWFDSYHFHLVRRYFTQLCVDWFPVTFVL